MAGVDWSGIATVIGSAATFVSACGLAFSHFRGSDDKPRYDGDEDEEETLANLEQQLHDLRERAEERRREQQRKRRQRRLDFTAWIRRRVTA